jgi:hypothetical protein
MPPVAQVRWWVLDVHEWLRCRARWCAETGRMTWLPPGPIGNGVLGSEVEIGREIGDGDDDGRCLDGRSLELPPMILNSVMFTDQHITLSSSAFQVSASIEAAGHEISGWQSLPASHSQVSESQCPLLVEAACSSLSANYSTHACLQ